MKKYIISFIFCAFYFYSATFLAAVRTDLTFGTMTMSGNVMANYDIVYKTKLSKNEHKFNVGSSIGMGYFVMDNLLVEAGLPVEFSMYNKSTYIKSGISLGTSYFFDIDSSVFPYISIQVSPLYYFHTKNFTLSTLPALGLLLSMSESVAFDFAIKSDIGIALSANDKWSFKNALGYAGIRAFF